MPSSDSNRSRWLPHPLWHEVERHLRSDLFEMIAGVEPGVIKKVKREDQIEGLKGQIIGLSASLFAAAEIEGDEGLSSFVARTVGSYMREHPAEFERKVKRSNERYVFL